MKKQNPKNNSRYIILLLLAVTTIISYVGVFQANFTNMDDNGYVTENSHVKQGLTKETIIWAFQTTDGANWHPLTWLSLALDSSLFGLNPMFFHGTNLLLHLLSSIILFLVFEYATRSRWQSAFVAFVFALHPLHVESVAWVSERKDVLAGLFWMLAMGSYILYHQSSRKGYYLAMLVMFTFGLMSKPMLVTFPFVLLLLDYWPLQRLSFASLKESKNQKTPPLKFSKAIVEKLPLLIITGLSSVVTFIAQREEAAMKLGDWLTLQDRMVNAIISYGTYIEKSVFPFNLAIFYPHPERNFSTVQLIITLVILAIVTFFVWKRREKNRFLVTGWLWFLGTLVPMIGIVQVGMQAFADRYMYVPLIGLSLVAAWGIPLVAHRMNVNRAVLSGAFIFIVAGMMYGSYKQVSYWKNTPSLFEHALAVTSNNYFAHFYLGVDLADSGRTDEAVQHLRESYRIKPTYPRTLNKLASVLTLQGKYNEALPLFEEDVRTNTPDAAGYSNYGVTLASVGKLDEAAAQWKHAIELDPNYAAAHSNLGRYYYLREKNQEAIQEMETALRLEPNDANTHFNYGKLLATQGRIEEARLRYEQALRLLPSFQEARKALEKLNSAGK